jgi:O-acetyl-ADP-ribose deacetylase (regulator of RNase III)
MEWRTPRCPGFSRAFGATIPHVGGLGAPGHEELVAELRVLRERGLLRLRGLPIPALNACVEILKLPSGDGVITTSVITLLERSVERLEGKLRDGAAYTLGVAQGTRHWPAQDRRSAAAEIYGVRPEHFRKQLEVEILGHVADIILTLCAEAAPADATPDPAGRLAPADWTSRRLLVPGPGRPAEITLLRMPVQLLRDTDIVVSSENVYLEMAKSYRRSMSGSLRAAAAMRGETGEVTDDVLQRELHEWLSQRGRSGLEVAPGTVVPTSSGALRQRGIRRVYHAAVVIPEQPGDGYVVKPEAVGRAVREVFSLARQERGEYSPPLRSVCLPLFGAGRGGLPPDTAMAYLWPELDHELHGQDGWDIRLITRGDRGALAAAAFLARHGAVPYDPES